MSILNKVFIGALLISSLSSCSKNSSNNEEKEGFNFELQIIDSIQVDVMENINSIDFSKDRGIVYGYQNRQITLFDSDGKTLKSKIYPKDGPGSIGYVTDLRILDNGDILVYPFGNKLVLLDADLEVKKHLEMPFPPELRGSSYFQHMFAVHGDEAYIFFPGRDGGNPYRNNFYKDYKMLEKLNLNSGISEATYKLPENSKYLSDLTYDYPTVTLSSGNDKIYLALDTESLIHVYDHKSESEAIETLDFNPGKFVQLPGEKAENVSSYGKLYKAGIKNLFAIPNGVVVHYTEGVEGEIFQREKLIKQENWSQLPNYNIIRLKVYEEGKGWSNDVLVPPYILSISGIHNLENVFYGFRHDDYLGEEQDFLTFYKLKLVRK